MGGDGGSIPTREELVKTKKRGEQKDKDFNRLARWNNCALTQEPLKRPIVACQLGRMYNKQTILEFLLDSKSGNLNEDDLKFDPGIVRHIKGIKDIRELQLTENPSFGEADDRSAKTDGALGLDKSRSKWICPMTSLEMNGHPRFVFDWSDGRVMSERAYKMVKEDQAMAIREANMVLLNPKTEADEESMSKRMESRKAREKAEKKAKKESGKKRGGEAEADFKVPDNEKASDEVPKKKKLKSASNSTKVDPTKRKDKKPDVQNDPTKSEAYKSLFDSHKSAQHKGDHKGKGGFWTTFDPRYN